MMVLTSRDDGTRLVSVEAPASGNNADVKQPLCSRPHSVCSEVSSIVLVDRRARLYSLCASDFILTLKLSLAMILLSLGLLL